MAKGYTLHRSVVDVVGIAKECAGVLSYKLVSLENTRIGGILAIVKLILGDKLDTIHIVC